MSIIRAMNRNRMLCGSTTTYLNTIHIYIYHHRETYMGTLWKRCYHGIRDNGENRHQGRGGGVRSCWSPPHHCWCQIVANAVGTHRYLPYSIYLGSRYYNNDQPRLTFFLFKPYCFSSSIRTCIIP